LGDLTALPLHFPDWFKVDATSKGRGRKEKEGRKIKGKGWGGEGGERRGGKKSTDIPSIDFLRAPPLGYHACCLYHPVIVPYS